jgi:hypothetical protein
MTFLSVKFKVLMAAGVKVIALWNIEARVHGAVSREAIITMLLLPFMLRELATYVIDLRTS